MDNSNEINVISIDDMTFLSKDGKTELNFDEWFDEYYNDMAITPNVNDNRKDKE